MSTGYLITHSGRVTGVHNGKPFAVEVDNPSYKEILEALTDENYQDFESLLNAALAVEKYSEGNIVVDGNTVTYKGDEVHNVIVEKIFNFMRAKLPFKPLLRFLDRLMSNPSMRAREELYPFLEYCGMPITTDGYFMAYKGLRKDYMDIHSGKFNNKPGSIHEMPRRNVDDDASRGCSYGFHVGTYEYASGFSQGQLVLCKVDPADVVSVPHDCSHQKVRTCRYEVIEDCGGVINDPLYRAAEYDFDEEVYDFDEEVEEDDL